MFAIFKKELRNYFTTPLGYVFIAVFLAVSGFVFSISTFHQRTSDISTYFQMMIFGYIVIIPLLTMRSFAEEKRTKTDQLLMTAPISVTSAVIAKFLAALTMFMGTVLVSCIYHIPLKNYGNVNVGKAVGCLIAMMLIGMCFISVGIFISTLTENIVTAATGTMAVLLGFAGAGLFNGFIDSYAIRYALGFVSVYSRYINFIRGLFDYSALVYYLSITAIFLFLSVRVCERRRYA